MRYALKEILLTIVAIVFISSAAIFMLKNPQEQWRLRHDDGTTVDFIFSEKTKIGHGWTLERIK